MWWALRNLILPSSSIQSVRTTPSNEAVTIDFRAVTLKAGDSRYTKVASISFDGESVTGRPCGRKRIAFTWQILKKKSL